MIRKLTHLLFVAAFIVAGAGPLSGRAEEPTRADMELVSRVAARIFERCDPVEGWAWPPLVYIINDSKQINANASVWPVKPGEEPKFPAGMSVTPVPVPGFTHIDGDLDEHGQYLQPVIRVFQGWLSVIVEGDDDALANCFGHETAHILLKHIEPAPADAPLFENVKTRDEEAAADIRGFELALEADYPYDALIESLLKERKLLTQSTAFQAYSQTHPGYTDRVALVEKHQPEVWRSLSGFEDGVYFLDHEIYAQAADCFAEVVRKQPKCYEAWANLGYAKLMLYCESMDAEELRSYDVGQLVLGGFYRHADSLGVRGDSAKNWEEAVDALQHALTLNPDLVVARANLAAAYLVHPAGKDVGAAAQEFAQVVKALEAGTVEEGVTRRMRAALLINAGVEEMAGGDAKSAESLFAKARGLYDEEEQFLASGQVASAIGYNRAVMHARSGEAAQQRSAVEEFEAYLKSNSPALAWWSLAYDAYAKLCRDQSVTPKAREELSAASATERRMVVTLALADGRELSLREPMEQVFKTMGEGLQTHILRNKAMMRVRYADQGIEAWGADTLLAIRLVGKKAPALRLKASGPGPADAAEIRNGMTFDEVKALVGSESAHWDQREGTSGTIVYRYFYNLGFGVRVSEDGTVTEIIVSQLPDEGALTRG